MKWKTLAVAAAGMLCLSGAAMRDAHAGGAGFYLSVGGGDTETKREASTGDIREDEKSSHRGFGFTFDTNLAKEQKMFNYRMSLGYERLEFKVDDRTSRNDGIRTAVNGFALEQDFGFGGRIARGVRLWGGPCIRLSYHHGDDDLNYDYKMAGMGIGPVMGINIGVGEPVTLSIRGGYLVNGYSGNYHAPGFGDRDFSASEDYFFLTFSTLFGSGE